MSAAADDVQAQVFAWDCRVECGADNPDVEIVIVGIDNKGNTGLYCAGCAGDIIQNPQMHEDDGIMLYGTHILADQVLREVFPADFG
jgi:transcription initiation factor TFIID subunit TAF12